MGHATCALSAERGLQSVAHSYVLLSAVHKLTLQTAAQKRHVDPALGNELGIGGVILSGLNMLSMTTRAIIAKIGNNDPSSLKSIYSNFSGSIFPGGSSCPFLPPLLLAKLDHRPW